MARTESEVPLEDARGMLTEGDSSCRAAPTSPETRACLTSACENSSMGTALSNTLRYFTREANTVTASSSSELVAGCSARAPPTLMQAAANAHGHTVLVFNRGSLIACFAPILPGEAHCGKGPCGMRTCRRFAGALPPGVGSAGQALSQECPQALAARGLEEGLRRTLLE